MDSSNTKPRVSSSPIIFALNICRKSAAIASHHYPSGWFHIQFPRPAFQPNQSKIESHSFNRLGFAARKITMMLLGKMTKTHLKQAENWQPATSKPLPHPFTRKPSAAPLVFRVNFAAAIRVLDQCRLHRKPFFERSPAVAGSGGCLVSKQKTKKVSMKMKETKTNHVVYRINFQVVRNPSFKKLEALHIPFNWATSCQASLSPAQHHWPQSWMVVSEQNELVGVLVAWPFSVYQINE